MTSIKSCINGAFAGFNTGALFRLANGQVWQQAHYRYCYHYAYRPEVEIRQGGSGHVMEVPCMGEAIEVTQATIVTEGAIVSRFTGFHADAEFEFINGQIWKQSEYKYAYHYAYRPEALVIDGMNGLVLNVEGMGQTVRVRRIK